MAGDSIQPDSQPGQPVTVSVEEWEKFTDNWALAVGRFIVAFGACEYWTHLIIRAFSPPNVADVCDGFMLGPRSSMAEAVLRDLKLPDDLQKRVDEVFKKLGDLAGSRNLVAHNPPMMSVRVDDKGNMQIGQDIVSARDARKTMDIARLRELTKEAVELDMTFMRLESDIRKWHKGR